MSQTKATRPSVRKPIISVQVVNMTCECGATCENEHGSTMIEYFDKIVWCQECLKQYEVPASVFSKTVKA